MVIIALDGKTGFRFERSTLASDDKTELSDIERLVESVLNAANISPPAAPGAARHAESMCRTGCEGKVEMFARSRRKADGGRHLTDWYVATLRHVRPSMLASKTRQHANLGKCRLAGDIQIRRNGWFVGSGSDLEAARLFRRCRGALDDVSRSPSK